MRITDDYYPHSKIPRLIWKYLPSYRIQLNQLKHLVYSRSLAARRYGQKNKKPGSKWQHRPEISRNGWKGFDFGLEVGPSYFSWLILIDSIDGRGDRIRTCDLVVPNDARYQLRYTPIWIGAPNGLPEREPIMYCAF